MDAVLAVFALFDNDVRSPIARARRHLSAANCAVEEVWRNAARQQAGQAGRRLAII